MLPFALLIICGAYLTVKSRFLQFTHFPASLKLIIKAATAKKDKNSGFTSLQSACTALSATVGTGNIAGVAGAISLGGAGAIFWMWVSALLGMIIKYTEITLGILSREYRGEKYVGGPMYCIKNLLPERLKILSGIFAFCALPAVFCTGNLTQTNAAILSVSDNYLVRLSLGIVFCLLTAVITSGGAKRIGAVTEKIMPVMALSYIALSVGVIISNIDFLPRAFKMIFTGAFNPRAVTGGCVGSVITCILTGASRGVFSNEAGLGTSAMAHASAVDADITRQGLFGIFEVFADTLIICTVTALTILCGGVNIEYGAAASARLVGNALFLSYGKAAPVLLSVMLCFFAFSSVIGWALYGDICASFLFGKKGKRIFLKLYPFGCILGAAANTGLAFRLSGIFNGIMLCINLPVIFLLSDKIIDMKVRKNERR